MPDPVRRRSRRRFDDDDPESTFRKRDRHRLSLPEAEAGAAVAGLPEGDRWSTWDEPPASERGPRPYPRWLVTDLAAADTELGVLKTGKEADVFLVRRGVPGTDRSCLLAAKRYRSVPGTPRRTRKTSASLPVFKMPSSVSTAASSVTSQSG